MLESQERTGPERRPVLLVLASTYPRWLDDPEPAFVHELAKRLTDRFRVIALVPHATSASTSETMEGVEVYRYRYAPARWETLVNDGGIVTNLRRERWKLLLVPSFLLAQGVAAWRLCRRLRPDVLHAHWLFPQGLIAALLQYLPGSRIPFVVTSHGADLWAIKGWLFDCLKRFIGRRAAMITVVSRAMQDELKRTGLGDSSVLPMGVDLDGRFTPVDGDRDQDELLFVGRLVEKKGAHVLIDAMPRILRSRPGVRLTIAGFGPEEPRLRSQADSLGVERSIRFLGAVPQANLPQLYRQSALFVAPFVESRGGDREGLGLVTVEAIACGCPVVVGDLPAVRDVLDQSEDAFMLVPPGDAAALADRVLEMLENPERGIASAARLRLRLLKRFNWQAIAMGYGDLLLEAGRAR